MIRIVIHLEDIWRMTQFSVFIMPQNHQNFLFPMNSSAPEGKGKKLTTMDTNIQGNTECPLGALPPMLKLENA